MLTAVKVAAIAASKGNPVRAKDRSTRVKTKGNTGKMQGLTMVSAPPRYASRNMIMFAAS